MVNRLLCKIAGHQINRHQVRDDGYHFHTECQRCGRPLRREFSGWIDAN